MAGLRLLSPDPDDGGQPRRVCEGCGSILGPCPDCEAKQVQLDGAEREIKAWRARYAALQRDDDERAKEHAMFPLAYSIFNIWRIECNHPRAQFSPDRFWKIEPFIRRHGEAMCIRAIRGAAYDPYVVRRKNGSAKRFDDWELIFRDEGKFEDFANRAPRGEGGRDAG